MSFQHYTYNKFTVFITKHGLCDILAFQNNFIFNFIIGCQNKYKENEHTSPTYKFKQSMSDDLVLGIDVGTTSVKCVVMKVDKQLKVTFA